MPLFILASATAVFVTFVVLLSQWALFRILLRDWKPRLSPAAWRAILCSLLLIWTTSGTGLLLEVFAARVPIDWIARLRLFATAVNMGWGCLSVCVLLVYSAYRAVVGPSANRFSPGRRKLLRASGLTAMAVPVVAAGYGTFIERKNFHVKEIDLPVPDLHPDLTGLRLVQISDLHISAYLSVSDAARVVDMANELRADIGLLTGDIISEYGDPLDASIRELGRLRATAGVLGCHGNHEIYARCQNRASRLCQEQGIKILRHEAQQLRFGSGVLNVAGVDFQSIGNRKTYLLETEKLIVPGATNILLSHSPDVFPVAVRKGFDATISGHTHAGQVTVEILNQTVNVARFVTPYVAGLYRLENRSCYVTAGIGTIGMPIRLGAPPEITLLRLRPA